MIEYLRSMADAIVSDVVSTSTLDQIRSLVEKTIADGDQEIQDMIDEGRSEEEATFYNKRYDPNEGPYSAGHADDCYDDGFYCGKTEGEYDLAVVILQILNKAS